MRHSRREQYEVVRLSYIEGLSHKVIAEVPGAPIGTGKSHLRLAYEEIRDAVEKKKWLSATIPTAKS